MRSCKPQSIESIRNYMKIIEIQERTPSLLQSLLEIWENSVRATHLFLSGPEIEQIKSYVPQALEAIPHLIVAVNENESNRRALPTVGEGAPCRNGRF